MRTILNKLRNCLSFIGIVFFTMTCQETVPSFTCADIIGCVDIAVDEPVSLAVVQALSGGPEPIGRAHSRAIELAIDSRGGQIMGHRIVLQVEDGKCSPEGGAEAAGKVVMRSKVVAILGTTCSASAVTVTKIMSKAGLVMISGANTAHSLTSAGGQKGANWQPGYFRTKYSDAQRGRIAAMYAFQELGVTRVATINDGDPYTLGLTNTFGDTFTTLGGKIVLDAAVNKGDTNMRPLMSAVASSGSELLFLPLFRPEGDYVVQQIKEISGLENIILMNSASLLLDTFIKNVGSSGVGMYFIESHFPQSARIEQLNANFEAKYGAPAENKSYPYSYDAANLLLDTIEAIAIRENNGTLHIGRQALRDALYATSGYEGITGKLSCDKFGDCGIAFLDIMRLDDPAAGISGVKANVIYTYRPEK